MKEVEKKTIDNSQESFSEKNISNDNDNVQIIDGEENTLNATQADMNIFALDIDLENAKISEDNNVSTDENSCVHMEIADESGNKLDYDKILKKKRFSLFFIRIFDVTVSFFGLLFLLPLFLIVSLAIIIESKGGVFFRQVRVGKNGKLFKIFKFRTMVAAAESKGLQITVGEDMRITKIGKVLRKTKLDELPQLINVIIGNMSLVGPRPEVPKYVELYTDEQKNILKIKPGITELASIVFRNENELLAESENPEQTYIDVIMQRKLKINLEYLTKIGFWYNIKLIFQTFIAILK